MAMVMAREGYGFTSRSDMICWGAGASQWGKRAVRFGVGVQGAGCGGGLCESLEGERERTRENANPTVYRYFERNGMEL